MKSIVNWRSMTRIRSARKRQDPFKTLTSTSSLPAYSAVICAPSSATRSRICSSVKRTSRFGLVNSVATGCIDSADIILADLIEMAFGNTIQMASDLQVQDRMETSKETRDRVRELVRQVLETVPVEDDKPERSDDFKPEHVVVNSLQDKLGKEFDRDESSKSLITEDDLRGLEPGSKVRIAANAKLTPLALDIV